MHQPLVWQQPPPLEVVPRWPAHQAQRVPPSRPTQCGAGVAADPDHHQHQQQALLPAALLLPPCSPKATLHHATEPQFPVLLPRQQHHAAPRAAVSSGGSSSSCRGQGPPIKAVFAAARPQPVKPVEYQTMQQWLAAGGAAAAQTPLLTPLPQQQLQLPQPAWRLSPSTAAGEVSDGGRAAPEGCGASAGPAHTHYEALAPSPQLRVVAAAAAAPHVLLTAPPICAYHTERFHSHSSNILFYLVDGGGNAALAVVGTDQRFSGHFTYATLPEWCGLPGAPLPLRCTSRGRVMDWLHAAGAREAVKPDQVKVPPLSAHQLAGLLSGPPVWVRSNLDQSYSGWRECTGELPDGRHYKHFWLTDGAAGGERLAVAAEDGQRRDRRYTYEALPDLGSFTFENGKEVVAWLEFITTGRQEASKAAAQAAAVDAIQQLLPASAAGPAATPLSRLLPPLLQQLYGMSGPGKPAAAGAAAAHHMPPPLLPLCHPPTGAGAACPITDASVAAYNGAAGQGAAQMSHFQQRFSGSSMPPAKLTTTALVSSILTAADRALLPPSDTFDRDQTAPAAASVWPPAAAGAAPDFCTAPLVLAAGCSTAGYASIATAGLPRLPTQASMPSLSPRTIARLLDGWQLPQPPPASELGGVVIWDQQLQQQAAFMATEGLRESQIQRLQQQQLSQQEEPSAQLGWWQQQQQQEPWCGHEGMLPTAAADNLGGGMQLSSAMGSDVAHAFASDPDLLHWVAGAPGEEALRRFSDWASQLTSLLPGSGIAARVQDYGAATLFPPSSSTTPPASGGKVVVAAPVAGEAAAAPMEAAAAGAAGGEGGGASNAAAAAAVSAISVDEACMILHAMRSHDVNLALLESSQICKPLALLRGHANTDLAALAATVADEWKGKAAAALEKAVAALQQHSSSSQQQLQLQQQGILSMA